MPFWQSQKAPTFEREDWSLFRTLDGLQQRAGVSKNELSGLVLKELADNGLDNGAKVTVESLPYEGGYVVEDDGTGIDGAPEDCQSASNFDPRSASNFDPLERRVRAVARAPS